MQSRFTGPLTSVRPLLKSSYFYVLLKATAAIYEMCLRGHHRSQTRDN